MKKYIIILSSAFFLFACGNEGDKKDTTETKADTKTTADAGSADAKPTFPPGITQADYDKGLQLIAGSDCLTCHKINEKFQGPAYAEVAKKYEPTEENIKMLAGKIIAGGQGVWGSIPMTPHDGLPEEDAKTMVKYIMTLKNVK